MDSANPYILIVEDDGAIRELLRNIVSSETDLPVKAVDNGKTALEVVSEGGCRLALLDMELPELDGETLASAIQQQASTPVHILLVSALPEHRILRGCATCRRRWVCYEAIRARSGVERDRRVLEQS